MSTPLTQPNPDPNLPYHYLIGYTTATGIARGSVSLHLPIRTTEDINVVEGVLRKAGAENPLVFSFSRFITPKPKPEG